MTPAWYAAVGLVPLGAWLLWWAALGRRRGLVDRGYVSRAAAAVRDGASAAPPLASPAYDVPLSRSEAREIAMTLLALATGDDVLDPVRHRVEIDRARRYGKLLAERLRDG